MARKKPDSQDSPVKEEGLRMVRLELPEESHKLLRLEAARRDVSLAFLAREAVEGYLKRLGNPNH